VPETPEVIGFLADRFPNVSDVVQLHGGEWSRAFAFRSEDRELVARFGRYREDYEKDRIAADWATPGLPIPAVVEIGDAFGGVYAVSHRRHGEKIYDLAFDRRDAVVHELFDLLTAIHQIELPGSGFGMWDAPHCDAPHSSWPDYLVSVGDRGEDRLRHWRQRLAEHPNARTVFDRGLRALGQLAPACPNIRRVVHNDLLLNVLVSADNEISAVFDWGNSLAGDPLYDVAMLYFSAHVHARIDPAQIMRVARDRIDEPDFDARVACYELHISLDAMQYLAYAGLSDHLETTMVRIESFLGRLT
jgi:hygromycin-B 4-O-kinase